LFTPNKRRFARFCSAACRREWWAETVQARAATTALAKLAELRAAGVEPTARGWTPERRVKMAASDRERPRRAQKEPV